MNEHRIWKMCRLALFEQGEGKKDLDIASYYKRDYVALGLLSNFIQITVVYMIIVAAIVLVKADYLIENFAQIKYTELLSKLIIGYVLLFGIYSAIVFTVRRLVYVRSRRRVRDHYIGLNELYEETADEDLKKKGSSKE